MKAASKRSAEQLDELAELTRPVSMAGEQTLPVLNNLQSILPRRTLQRGITVVVQGGPGTHSLALALAAGASQSGSWVAAAGTSRLGAACAVELGIALERLVLITAPPSRLWPVVTAALIDAFELVLVEWPEISPTLARRLGLRARERRTTLIPVSGDRAGGWDEAAELRLTVDQACWHGLEQGHGRLSTRRLEITTGGKRAPVPYRSTLWLPDWHGGVAAGTPAARALAPE